MQAESIYSNILYIIYIATNIINNKSYIGFTGNYRRRKGDHIRLALQGSDACKLFYRSIRTYGADNFVWEFLYLSPNGETCLKVMEPYFISIYNTHGKFGLNGSKGGESTYHRPNKHISQAHKNKLSIVFSGEGNPFYGKNHTQKTKNTISIKNGGKNHPKYGKHDSQETKDKKSIKARKKYLATFPDGHTEEVCGLKIFCEKYGLSYSNICQYIRLQKPNKGFLLKKIE